MKRVFTRDGCLVSESYFTRDGGQVGESCFYPGWVSSRSGMFFLQGMGV